MFLSRTGSYWDLAAWLMLCGLWCYGGWMISLHIFRLRSRERFFSGAAIGLLLFIVLSDLLAHVLPLQIAFWIAALLIAGLGLVAAWFSPIRPRFPIADLKHGSLFLGFILLLVLLVRINFGLAVFDDFANLPIVSRLATGDIPLHFYLNPDQLVDYHYGQHLFASSMVRTGGMYPWIAMDFSKALSVSLAVILAWLWFRRYLGGAESRGGKYAWIWVVTGVLFIGGARWLLLLAPQTWLQEAGKGLQLQGSAVQTGTDLYTALISAWKIEGDGPFPFPFAFTSGIFRPLSMAMDSSAGLPLMAIFLLLLLARRRWGIIQALIAGLILTSMALIAEQIFVLSWGGLFLAILARWIIERNSRAKGLDGAGQVHEDWRRTISWGWILIPAPLLVPFMGGIFSAVLQRGLAQLSGAQASTLIAMPGLALRWPPAIFSAHLGELSLFDPTQLLLALAEIGPVILLAPLALRRTPAYLRSGKLLVAGLAMMSVVSFLTPLFIRFNERDRDISRLTSAALLIWFILALPDVWYTLRKRLIHHRSGYILQVLTAVGCGTAILGGLAYLPSQMVGMAQPQASYFIQFPDIIMSQLYWDRLEDDAWVIDLNFHYRPTVLFGRTTGPAYRNLYIPLPEYRELALNPDPVELARAGYDYLYIDRETWWRFSPDQRSAFQSPCVRQVKEQRDSLGDFRRLLDLRKCAKSP